MKIVLYSSVFYPSIGGVETISATLANLLTELGHECVVLTETPAATDREWPYPVIRRPSLLQRFELVRKCELVHSNGASLALFPLAKLAGKPFIWTHNGYQVSCIDGLGWRGNEPAPLDPWGSINFYLRREGIVFCLREAGKLGLRRLITNFVDLNIACTNWVANRQPLRNQLVAYTPYYLNQFREHGGILGEKKYDFIFVGRLVGEKGASDLINAFGMLISRPDFKDKTLAIVGKGPLLPDLETLAFKLGIQSQVFFLGPKYGSELVKTMRQANFGVVPSIWEEPMGGVSLEFLASGMKVVVSNRGGHAECVGEAGITFDNGNVESLYNAMLTLIDKGNLNTSRLANPQDRANEFNELKLTNRYVEIYKAIVSRKRDTLFKEVF